MQLIVDANVLFSAAIKDSKTAELLVRDDLELYAPEYLFEEFEKYEGTLLEKTHRTGGDFQEFVDILRKRIELVSRKEFDSHLSGAMEVTPDEDDAPYFALAMHLGAAIWSDDRELEQQEQVNVLTTKELIEKLG